MFSNTVQCYYQACSLRRIILITKLNFNQGLSRLFKKEKNLLNLLLVKHFILLCKCKPKF